MYMRPRLNRDNVHAIMRACTNVSQTVLQLQSLHAMGILRTRAICLVELVDRQLLGVNTLNASAFSLQYSSESTRQLVPSNLLAALKSTLKRSRIEGLRTLFGRAGVFAFGTPSPIAERTKLRKNRRPSSNMYFDMKCAQSSERFALRLFLP